MSELKKYQVYHVPHGYSIRFEDNHNALTPPEVPTAIVLATDLEDVFRKTQHGWDGTTNPWFGTQHSAIMLCVRSTSKGDIIVDPNKKAWVVDFAGFVPYEGDVNFN